MCCPKCPQSPQPYVAPYNPCEGCEWLGKPYWSIVSPCQGCTRRGGYTTFTPTVTWTTAQTNSTCGGCE